MYQVLSASALFGSQVILLPWNISDRPVPSGDIQTRQPRNTKQLAQPTNTDEIMCERPRQGRKQHISHNGGPYSPVPKYLRLLQVLLPTRHLQVGMSPLTCALNSPALSPSNVATLGWSRPRTPSPILRARSYKGEASP